MSDVFLVREAGFQTARVLSDGLSDSRGGLSDSRGGLSDNRGWLSGSRACFQTAGVGFQTTRGFSDRL